MKKGIVLLLFACMLAPLIGLAANKKSKVKVTKGAPAKGSSDLDFDETVEQRKQSLGRPEGEKNVMKADTARNLKAITAAQELEKQDKACMARVQDLIMADPKSLNQADHEGRTMLHQAAFAGYAQTVQYLLKRGADSTLRDGTGATPAQLARLAGHADIASTIDAYKP